MLNYAEARAYYNRFGAQQDLQGWYEDPPVEVLLRHADFSKAANVFELGCGTGRLAHRLLTQSLPATARYWSVEVSDTMVGLTRERLAEFGDRAQVTLTEGALRFPLPDHSVDRFLSTYVLDLLSPSDIAASTREAHRVLQADGKLCLVSLTHGERGWARLASWGWARIHALWPARFGGCRPIRLLNYLAPAHWRIAHHSSVRVGNITSEVVVATPITNNPLRRGSL